MVSASKRLLALALFLMLLCAPAALAAQEQSPIQFTSTEPIELDWTTFITKGAEIIVLKSTGVSRDLTVEVSDITLETENDGELHNSVELVSTTIRLLSMATVELRPSAAAGAAAPTPGTYEGYLSVTDPQENATIHRPITVVVAAPGASKPEALVSSWSVTAYRGSMLTRLPPFNERCDGWTCVSTNGLPVTAESAAMKFKGALVGDAGGMATAWTTPTTTTLLASPSSPYTNTHIAPLYFDHLDYPGTYSGTIAADPDAEDGQIELSVTVKHDPLWPILVMLGSGGLAVLLYHYGENHLFRRRRLSSDIEALAVPYEDALEGSGTDKRPKLPAGFRNYDIHCDMYTQQHMLRERVRNLPWRIIRLDSNPEYKALRGEVDSYKTIIDQWPSFPAALDELENRLTKAAGANSNPSPSFLADGGMLIKGQPIKLNEVQAVLDNIAATTRLAITWVELVNWYAVVGAKFIALNPKTLPDDVQLFYRQAARFLNESAAELRRVESIEELTELGTRANLRNAEKLVDQLAPLQQPGYAGAASSLDLEAFDSRPMDQLSITSARAADQPGSASARAAVMRSESSIRGWNWLFFIVAVAVAILSGLQSFYFDKAFGSVADYIGVFLWAFAATTLLEGIVSALDRVLTPGLLTMRLPLR
jgi:hypothetical protein